MTLLPEVVAGAAVTTARLEHPGQVVETGTVAAIIRDPRHPYTRALLASLPTGQPGARIAALPGSVPGAAAMPPGCRFHPRCPVAIDPCAQVAPRLQPASSGRILRCIRAEELVSADD